jgi:hypothetical protein
LRLIIEHVASFVMAGLAPDKPGRDADKNVASARALSTE